MKFQQLYSSSSGNAYVITAASGKRLLIECGVPWSSDKPHVPTLLKALGHDLTDIEGCLLTHEHKDHSKAVKDVMKAAIDVYSSAGTIAACFAAKTRRAKIAPISTQYDPKPFGVGEDFRITAYRSNHDATEPLLYVVRCDGELLLFATDTSHINQHFPYKFDIIAIECSYNEPYLRKRVEKGTINEQLAKRLLESHMSESNCLSYLQNYCNLDKCREIHLLHLSADNINKTRIKREFAKKLFIEIKVI